MKFKSIFALLNAFAFVLIINTQSFAQELDQEQAAGESEDLAESESPQPQYDESAIRFVSMLFTEGEGLQENLDFVAENWQPGFTPMALETIRMARRMDVIQPLVDILRRNTEQGYGYSPKAWNRWLWSQPEENYIHFAQFKSLLYRLIDQKFAGYFDDERESTIRLDEITWGGVGQDGIPPLRQPKMMSAEEATYLGDDDVVFGVEINGDARAYPNRILAWHEMFVDEIGGTEFAGVYCTLCGAVILYETHHEGVRHELGTSGFLYRSNKLMYDKATQSLWNTTWGEPVVGPLVGKDIQLKRSYIVTTSWGEWKRRHPDTTVLSLDTGHERDYGEGVAYQQYFATDQLMFDVPETDKRLNNKDQILALVFPEFSDDTLAIHADYLVENPVHYDALGELEFVVLTDASGANRVYDVQGIEIQSYDGDATVVDADGNNWKLEEFALVGPNGKNLPRLAAHRAFWFGWYAANNDTRLVM